jgi:hypothetical protein
MWAFLAGVAAGAAGYHFFPMAWAFVRAKTGL